MNRGISAPEAPVLDPTVLMAEVSRVLANPDLAACIVLVASRLAWTTHGNTVGAAYAERRDLFAKLRGAVAAYEAMT